MSPLVILLFGGLALVVAGDVLEFRAVDSTGVRPSALRLRTPRLRTARRTNKPARQTLLVFASCAALYLVVAAYVVLHRGGVMGDAGSRVAQAWYVVGSRDPHIGGIGFVWNPLPSIAAIPFVLLHRGWPALTEDAFAGCIVSALCMAGAVVQLRATLTELGASPAVSIAGTAAFALNPMVIAYGANGMSEAMYLLFLIGATRYLLQWTVQGRLRPLVLTGLNLAAAFLTRYEALAAAFGAIVVVLIVGTVARDPARSRRERLAGASADALVVGLPVAVAFGAWAAVSWIITGEAFAQFTSRYGNSSLVAAAGVQNSNGTGWPKLGLVAAQIGAYAPLLVLVGACLVLVAFLRRDRRALALVVLIAPVAFSVLSFANGTTFGFLRYYIPVVPLVILATVLLLEPLRSMTPGLPRWLRAGGVGAVALVLVVGASSAAGTAAAMANVHLAPEEVAAYAWLFHKPTSPSEQQGATLLSSAHSIARELDALNLGNSAVAVDTFDCGSFIVLASQHPHAFVITSDRDFERITADPVAFHVPYVLVPNGENGIEAISLAHPGIYGGGQVGSLSTHVVKEFDTPGCPAYRLVRVDADGS